MSPPPRRSSFGMLLRRSKSSDLKGGKKAQALREAELERQRQASLVPPKLPEFTGTNEQLSKSFSPELRLDSSPNPSSKVNSSSRNVTHAVPIPPIPPNAFDPYARTESMTNRGRFSYASSAVSSINSPRRVRRRKDPTPFNILVIGTRGAGKTSFLEFLKTALALPPKKRSRKTEEDEFRLPPPASGNFIPHYLESEIDGERVGLTLWDSEGLEKNMVDLQLREMTAFVESKFEETFTEEMKVIRSPGVQDTHIHATFLVLDPARLDRNLAASRNWSNGYANGNGGPHMRVIGGLDEDLDLQVMRALQGKTTVIPVIAKADTITTKHMNVLKKTVWESIKKANLDPLEALGLDEESSDLAKAIEEESEEDEDAGSSSQRRDTKTPTSEEARQQGSPSASPNSKRLSIQSIRKHKEDNKDEELPFLPLSIISPDLYEPGVVGRQFPWGFADPYNEQHCDFVRLQEAVFTEWRSELREASKEQWYEGWRTTRLKHRNFSYNTRR